MKRIAALFFAAFLAAATSATGQSPAYDPKQVAEGGNDTKGLDMAPETRLEVVEAAVAEAPKIPPGTFEPTWESLEKQYKVPRWFTEAKFGIFMHWGLYSVPAHHNEWYEKHMYGNAGIRQWHEANFGPVTRFGYKDFIPKFTAERFDPKQWADLFKRAGARYVMPAAQHHDNFALWDSEVTPFNAMDMGPKRDLIGELAREVRAAGMKFCLSNHGIENFEFIEPTKMPAGLLAEMKEKRLDLFDPQWLEFYNVADRSDAACKRFLIDWARRNAELIDKYQPDMLWFDNGIDMRFIDPLKLWVAAYYYNRAAEWKKEVSLSSKKAAYAPSGTNMRTIASIIDFEKVGGRSPAGIRPGAWQVDDPIGSTWGYTTKMTVSKPASILHKLIDTASKNGTYLLNISPMADGTIPQAQQDVLLEIGRWLETNGEAIYATRAWTTHGGDDVRLTMSDEALYAILLKWPASPDLVIEQLKGHDVRQVTLLGGDGKPLKFTSGSDGLRVTLAAQPDVKHAWVLKCSGVSAR